MGERDLGERAMVARERTMVARKRTMVAREMGGRVAGATGIGG